VARQWRANLRTLVDQLADGWALLVEDAARFTHPRIPDDHATRRDPRGYSVLPFTTARQEPMEQRLRQYAWQSGIRHAPADFTARVQTRLPADPPPFDVIIRNPYQHLREHSRLVVGTLSFSALLMFGSSWLIAVIEPALAFAILAALVSLVILLADGLRFLWQMAASAASNPLLLLLAMLAPLGAFLVVATQLPHWSADATGLREA
jgi:hypothetical protein